jgi:hypothetical protein
MVFCDLGIESPVGRTRDDWRIVGVCWLSIGRSHIGERLLCHCEQWITRTLLLWYASLRQKGYRAVALGLVESVQLPVSGGVLFLAPRQVLFAALRRVICARI